MTDVLSDPVVTAGRTMTVASDDGAVTTLPAPRGRSRVVSTLLLIGPPLAVLAVLVGFWQWYVVRYHVRPSILPSPLRVVQQGWRAREALWNNTKPTMQVTFIGFGVSLVVAWVLAILIDFSAVMRRGLMPVLVASQTLPIIAIAPLMIIWFGFGLLPKILVIALVTFFPVTVALVEGFGSAEREATNLLRSMGAGKWKRFRYARLPSALPFFFAGLRIAITYAVVGAIFAEYVGAEKGLGIYMSLQKNSFRTDLVLAAVLVTAVVSIMLFACTYVLQALCIPWYTKARRQGRA